MQPEVRNYLWDVRQAGRDIIEFTDGTTYEDYEADRILRAAVERQFITVGEALSRAAKIDPGLVVNNARLVIAFRNVLVHGYAAIQQPRVWDTLKNHLPALLIEVDRLIEQSDADPETG